MVERPCSSGEDNWTWKFFAVKATKAGENPSYFNLSRLDGGEQEAAEPNRYWLSKGEVTELPPERWPEGVIVLRTRLILEGRIETE